MATDQTLVQLDEYYKLNLLHLRLSFGSSLFALFVGLAALLVGIWFLLHGNTGLTTQLIVIGGVLTQFIGAGFFYLYSKNLRQLNVFYEKLIKHKDTLYAISLANQVSEPDKTSAVMAVIGALLTRGEPPTSPDVLRAIIESKGGRTGV